MRKVGGALTICMLGLLSSLQVSRGVIGEGTTPLAELAASMTPGTWAKLTTHGLTQAMIYPSGAMAILAYSMNIVWDSSRHVGYFYGGEHTALAVCGNPPDFNQLACADASQRFLKYDEPTNTWALQLDSITGKPHSGIAASPGTHGNGELTLDPSTGDLYKHHFFGTTNFQKFSRSTQSWSAMANPNTEGFIPGFAWFPEANGIVRVHGGYKLIDFWRKESNKWSTLFTSVNMAVYPGVAIYNPVLHNMLVSGGCAYPPNPGDDRNFHILTYNSGSWKLSPARQTPVFLVSGVRQLCLDSAGEAGHVSIDPITGKYIVITRDALNDNIMFEYDSQANTWMPMTGSRVPPPTLQMGEPLKGSGGLMASAGIPEYGVLMYLNATSTGAEVWLYKHAQSAETGTDTPKPAGNETGRSSAVSATTPGGLDSFSQKCAMAGVLRCVGFDQQSELRYFWPSASHWGDAWAEDICDRVLASAQPNYYFTPLAEPYANVRATIQNGQCIYATIDTAVKHSGAGSLRFPIPSHSDQDSSGEFAEPFKKYADGTFGYVGPATSIPTASAHHEGDELWVQWYQRIDSGMLQPFDGYLYKGYYWTTTVGGALTASNMSCDIPSTAVGHTLWFQFGTNFTKYAPFAIASVAANGCSVVLTSSPTPYGAGGSPLYGYGFISGRYPAQRADGWKQFGVYGNPPNTSCCGPATQISVNVNQLGVPQVYSYDQNGTVLYGVQDVRRCKWVDYNRANYPEPPCVRYKADQWQEYTVHIKVRGRSGQHASIYQKWIDGQLVQDLIDFALTWGNVDTANGLGQFNLNPYDTQKDPNQPHADTAVWYDDVIISTQPIPMANGRRSVKN